MIKIGHKTYLDFPKNATVYGNSVKLDKIRHNVDVFVTLL